MAAAVAQSGQGVVLGENPDPRAGRTASASQDAANRGRQPTGRMLNRVTVAGDRFGNPRSCPLFFEGHKGGPDFVEASLRPYFLAYDSAVRPGTSDVLEVPCTSALDRDVPDRLAWLYARAPFPYQTRRVLRKLGIARVQWIRPSYSSLDDMKALARRLAGRGEPVLNMLFHSSEAIVGGSPYNRTQAELDAFFDRLERFLEYAVRELGARAMTYREFRDHWIRN